MNGSPEYPSVSTTSKESYNELQIYAISPRMPDAEDQLSEMARRIPLVNLEVLILEHSAFLAQLPLEEVDLESTVGESYDHTVLSLRRSDSQTGEVSAAEPSLINMLASEHDVQDLQKVLWA